MRFCTKCLVILLTLCVFAACKKSPYISGGGSRYTYLITGTRNFHRIDCAYHVNGYSDSVQSDTSFAISYLNAGAISIGKMNLLYDTSYMYRDSILHFYYNGHNVAGVQQLATLVFDRYANSIVFNVQSLTAGETDISSFATY